MGIFLKHKPAPAPVFCEDCRHEKSWGFNCWHPENLSHGRQDYCRRAFTEPRPAMTVLKNRHGDCKLYEPKGVS